MTAKKIRRKAVSCALPPLQSTHGARLCPLGASLHRLARPPTPPRDGGGRGHGLPLFPCQPGAGRRGHAEPGLGRAPFHVSGVLHVELPWLSDVVRAKQPRRLPSVLTEGEVGRLLPGVEGICGLMARLMYGTGMRISECVALRVKGLDPERREIAVRQGKGGKDRMTMLPATLVAPLLRQLDRARQVFDQDRGNDVPGVELPFALARKYPAAARERT